MVWQDPKEEIAQEPLSGSPDRGTSIGGGLPSASSYGTAGPTWNKEAIELLVDIEIPKDLLDNGPNAKLLVWTKKVLMQMQFGNYTKADQTRMIKHLRYIIFLSQQEGNEQIVFEEQLIFVSTMQIGKGRSDKPDGLRERVLWAMQIFKNIFTNEDVKKPEENSSKFSNLPFSNR